MILTFLSLDGDDDNDSVKTYSLTDLMAEKISIRFATKKLEREIESKIYMISIIF